jgi:hypothetical protein
VPDVFTWLGPPVFAEATLPLKVNISEIAKRDTAFDIAISLICCRSIALNHDTVRPHMRSPTCRLCGPPHAIYATIRRSTTAVCDRWRNMRAVGAVGGATAAYPSRR